MILDRFLRRTLLLLLWTIGSVVHASGDAWLLLDLESRRVIASEGASKPVPAQSTVVLMTLYAALELQRTSGIDASEAVELEPAATQGKNSSGPRIATLSELSRILLMTGDQGSTRALVGKLSENDAAFTMEMNRLAKQLGLHDSHFTSPYKTDDPAQTTTPADLAVLAEALFRDFPETRLWSKTRIVELAGHTVNNTNTLLERSNAIAGVFRNVDTETADAVVLFENPRANGALRRLMAVVLRAQDGADLDEKILSLLGNGYRNYETIEVYETGEVIAQLPVYKGSATEVGVRALTPVLVTVERTPLLENPSTNLKVEISYRTPLTAPIIQGDAAGEMVLTFANEEVARIPVYFAENVQPGPPWKRLIDALRLALKDENS